MADRVRPGRRPEDGPRFPGGRRRPQVDPRGGFVPGDGRGDVLYHRISSFLDDLAVFGLDAGHATQIIRLRFQGLLTATEVEAGLIVGMVYRELGRYGMRRATPRSGALDGAVRGDGADPLVDPQMLTRRALEARRRYDKVQAEIDSLPAPSRARFRAAIEQLCVEDQPIDTADLAGIKAILGWIGEAFGLGKADDGRRSIAITAHRPRRQSEAKQRGRTDFQRNSFQAIVAGLVPDIDQTALDSKWTEYEARVAREIVRARKARGRA